VRRALVAAAALAALAGCPEERPGTEKRIPGERVPPAMSVDPAPALAAPARAGAGAPDAAASADGGARR
jgi:hypothetical protein